MGKILYIHGFKSTGNARKAQILKKKYEILSPTLPISPKESMFFLEKVMKYNEIDLIVGSSLGGFYAFLLHKQFKCKVLLINPSLEPWKTLAGQIGLQERFVTGETFFWTETYNNELENLAEEAKILKVDESKLFFFIANDDELLNHSRIPQLFQKANIQCFDGVGHEFRGFLKTVNLIDKIL